MAVDKRLPDFAGEPLAEEGIVIEVPDDDVVTTETEDGGVVIDFEATKEPGEDVQFDANLAEHLEDAELTVIGLELLEDYRADRTSRSEWEEAYRKGLKLLGLKVEERMDPWPKACGVFHPLLTEAIVRFQSHAVMETFPPSGPVKTKIIGKKTKEREKQSARIREDMNYITTKTMPEYRSEHERMLINLALAGSGFKKCWNDPVKKRPVAMYVPADDLVAAYGTTDLREATRFTHVMREPINTIRKRQVVGFYRDIDIIENTKEYSETEETHDEVSGEASDLHHDNREVLYEVHVDYDLPSPFDDPDGIARPHIVTLDAGGEVLSIYRNWLEDDETMQARQHFSHYVYLPGLGFYGIGLIHLIGGLTQSATSIIRQLVDAGTLANLPGGFKARGFRVKNEDDPHEPGQWRDVDIPGEDIAKSLFPFPYKEPSAVLFQLLGMVTEEGRRLGSIAEMDIPSSSGEMPVGTTLAFMERSLKVMSAVQSRLHASMEIELTVLANLIRDHMPDEYPFETDPGATRALDYDDRVDVCPVSDPNATTMAQKAVVHQVVMQAASQAPPNTYNMSELHRGFVDALNMPNADKVVPVEDDLVITDPVSENMRLLTQEPVKVFPSQDHEAHIRVHMAAMEDPKIKQLVGQNPAAQAIAAAGHAHIAEHVAHQYRREIEKMVGAQLPAYEEVLPEDVERNVSKLMADAADKVLKKDIREAQAMENARQSEDPILQIQKAEQALKEQTQKDDVALKSRELDIKASEVKSRTRQAGAKIGADLVTDEKKESTKRQIAGVEAGIRVLEGQSKEKLAGEAVRDARRDRKKD